MKLIHTADIHLGSKLDSKFPREISEKRKSEVRGTFKRIVDYAKANDIGVILLCGDVFDSDRPFKKDRDFFYSVVRNNPEVDFLYLRGNHDVSEEDCNKPQNLKTFSSGWQSYFYGDVCVCGLEIDAQNAVSMYPSLNLDETKVNIVMLHGEASDFQSKGKINLRQLRNKNIDYLALGHIHAPREGKLDDRGVFVYPGCPEGRGFDECGEHGFVLLDASSDGVSHKFVPFAERTINEVHVDISDAKDFYEASLKVREKVAFVPKDIYRVVLEGSVDCEIEDLEQDVAANLKDSFFFVDVKDETRRKIDIREFEFDKTLRGEFVRTVFADPTLDEADKLRVIANGLEALRGEKF